MITKKLMAMVLAVILAFGSVALVACAAKPTDKTQTSTETTTESVPITENDYKTEFANTQNVMLAAVTPMSMTRGTNTVSQTLQATITPETATNQKVSWSVSWEDSSKTATVTNYVTVTPQAAGSKTATVTCHQPFDGNILVTVTTEEGGFAADCIVTFVGIPSSIDVSCANVTPNGDTYGLGVGTNYDFAIHLDNAFGQVGDKYKKYNIGVMATGTLTVGTYESDPRGSKIWSNERTANLSEFTDDILSYSVEGNTLKIKFNKSIEGYYSSMKKTGSVRTYYDKVKSVNSDCYFTITVSTQEIGVSMKKQFKVAIDGSVVTGVTVNSTMEF